VNQEESEHSEVDGMKKGVDSKGEVMQYSCIVSLVLLYGYVLVCTVMFS